MDLERLAGSAIGLVISYGEQVAGQVGERLVSSLSEDVYRLIERRLAGDQAAENVLTEVREKPGDRQSAQKLTRMLLEIMASDPRFAEAVDDRVRQAMQAGVVHNVVPATVTIGKMRKSHFSMGPMTVTNTRQVRFAFGGVGIAAVIGLIVLLSGLLSAGDDPDLSDRASLDEAVRDVGQDEASVNVAIEGFEVVASSDRLWYSLASAGGRLWVSDPDNGVSRIAPDTGVEEFLLDDLAGYVLSPCGPNSVLATPREGPSDGPAVLIDAGSNAITPIELSQVEGLSESINVYVPACNGNGRLVVWQVADDGTGTVTLVDVDDPSAVVASLNGVVGQDNLLDGYRIFGTTAVFRTGDGFVVLDTESGRTQHFPAEQVVEDENIVPAAGTAGGTIWFVARPSADKPETHSDELVNLDGDRIQIEGLSENEDLVESLLIELDGIPWLFTRESARQLDVEAGGVTRVLPFGGGGVPVDAVALPGNQFILTAELYEAGEMPEPSTIRRSVAGE